MAVSITRHQPSESANSNATLLATTLWQKLSLGDNIREWTGMTGT